MASVFHDTLQADVGAGPAGHADAAPVAARGRSVLPYRSVDVLAIQPSQSLDAMAQARGRVAAVHPQCAAGGRTVRRGGALASYLLFEPGFVQA